MSEVIEITRSLVEALGYMMVPVSQEALDYQQKRAEAAKVEEEALWAEEDALRAIYGDPAKIAEVRRLSGES